VNQWSKQEGEQDKAIEIGRYGVHHNAKGEKYSIRNRTDNRAVQQNSLEGKIMGRVAHRINGSEGTQENKNESCGRDTKATARQM